LNLTPNATFFDQTAIMFQSIVLFGALAASVLAQSAAQVDAKSGISFVQWAAPEKLSFGIALPTDAKNDFIAQIVSKDNGRRETKLLTKQHVDCTEEVGLGWSGSWSVDGGTTAACLVSQRGCFHQLR
jgi:hypothetical protein